MRIQLIISIAFILAWCCSENSLLAQETVRAVPAATTYPSLSNLPWQESDGTSNQETDLGALAPQDDQQRPLHSPFDPSTMNSDTWPTHPIQAIRLDIRASSAPTPADRSINLISSSPNQWELFAPAEKLYCWCAPNIHYQPLWFEDVALERYGQTFCDSRIQTAASAAHFFLSTLTLPYHAAADPYYECDYPLGYFRPGDCAPPLRQKFLFHW